ncbi:MAG: acyl-CoA thioesterase [Prevotella sp.]|jgi:acyl-CoA thioester hydrolase|nr:acyl-CoA thioesterase [Prevotella sp.]MBP3745798.1 acyl-CoA thioesterase [Prevotella sp.]MBQ1854797.1 acyl-CoA thioesterase [Prevotella sp.]MBQ2060853.1 acyl-CoA thioesterase [Prevotella sp.]MBQ2337623.1 acyl-CoA thioesterase [Prevotella sp.]
MTQQIQEETVVYRHVMPLQIRWNDVDKFGHVNNSVYFQYYDTAKTDYIASLCEGVNWDKYAIVVVHIESDFYAQVKAGSHIAVRTRVKHVGNKSFHLDQEVIDADSEEVKCHCLSVMVLYDLEEQKSILIPEKWAKAIRDFEGLNED